MAQAAEPAVSDGEIVFASAAALTRSIRAKKFSSEEVTKAFLKRIEAVNPKLNAVVLLVADSALAQARKADQELARGAKLGPLHGVPMTVITTGATKGFVKRLPTGDAVAVARMKAAGAILLGKTNLPEMAMACETDNAVFGRANNPYNLARSTAGSSGAEERRPSSRQAARRLALVPTQAVVSGCPRTSAASWVCGSPMRSELRSTSRLRWAAGVRRAW
jgi:amidase